MFFHAQRVVLSWPFLLLALILPAAAAPTGPTLEFDYGAGQPKSNSVGKFMYFVPLISPEGVCVHTNLGNTQCARVDTFHCHTNAGTFHAVCEFVFEGTGQQRNVFDHLSTLQERHAELAAGKALPRQLSSIEVAGAGCGTAEIDGVLTNGRPAVTEIRLRFNSRGQPSPVSVDLQDITLKNGSLHFDNETIARVNTLTFRPKSPPRMEVTLASVKRADAGNSRWQNFIGELKGAAANLLLPPIKITAKGQTAMMDFGRALAMEQPTFSFPFAERLTNGAAIKP